MTAYNDGTMLSRQFLLFFVLFLTSFSEDGEFFYSPPEMKFFLFIYLFLWRPVFKTRQFQNDSCYCFFFVSDFFLEIFRTHCSVFSNFFSFRMFCEKSRKQKREILMEQEHRTEEALSSEQREVSSQEIAY